MMITSDGFESLLSTIHASGKNYNVEKITKAYEIAKMLHEGQFRKSGEAYICHPVAVAKIVANLGLDTDSICAALLHIGRAVAVPLPWQIFLLGLLTILHFWSLAKYDKALQ